MSPSPMLFVQAIAFGFLVIGIGAAYAAVGEILDAIGFALGGAVWCLTGTLLLYRQRGVAYPAWLRPYARLMACIRKLVGG